MTFHSYQKLWKAYVDVFAGILLTDETVGHANDGSPAGRRLGQLCLESGRLRTCLCFEHPTRYIGYNYSMGEVQATLPDTHSILVHVIEGPAGSQALKTLPCVSLIHHAEPYPDRGILLPVAVQTGPALLLDVHAAATRSGP